MPHSEIGDMKYPYYIVPDVEAYRSLDPQSEEARLLSRRIAANVGDYASLRLILGIDPPEFARFYPDMEPSTPSTMSTIDTFLSQYGKDANGEEFVPEVLREMSSPVKNEDIEEKDSASEITLGQLLKENRYDDAIMLIEHQNLNNTQKSIYFAHQMRFIKKLKALDNYRKQNQGRRIDP